VSPTRPFPKAFIIRPFGEKEILVKPQAGATDPPKRLKINFDDVEAKLIKPAMQRAGLTGDTVAQEFIQAGSIPRDMFQLLLTAELVIADISIHNANVFYELGIRHALRDKRTFLIRCNVEGHDTPFDIRTERYLLYDRDDPSKAIDLLSSGLEATVRSNLYDSPMFTFLPDLQSQDVSRFVVPPERFSDRIRAAESARLVGDIQFLADEVANENWGLEALRSAGRAQMNLGAWLGAARLWEQVRSIRAEDTEADLNLGRAYAIAGRYEDAKSALLRLRRKAELSSELRARTYSLLGENAARRWVDEWKRAKGNRNGQALKSPALRECWESHLEAFQSDLHDITSGAEALFAGTILLDLAQREPGAWKDIHDEDDEAAAELKSIGNSVKRLEPALALALSKAEEREKAGRLPAGSALRCQAELSLVTSTRTGAVADRYRKAVAAADHGVIQQMQRRLSYLMELGVLKDKAEGAAKATEEAVSLLPAAPPAEPVPHVVAVFLGMLDENLVVADEAKAKAIWLKELQDLSPNGERVCGLAGASPAEILFHEACESLLLPGAVYLSHDDGESRLDFENRWSAAWKQRFEALLRRRGCRKLEDGPQPTWLPTGYDVRTRTARWMMHNALQHECSVVLFVPASSSDGGAALNDLLSRLGHTAFSVNRINLNT
jgi:hypothetical protein